MKTLIKQCKYCSKEFEKQCSDSSNYWKVKSFCSSRCAGLHNKPALKLIGRKRPQEVVEKLKRTMFKTGQIPPMKGRHNWKISGERSHLWKGGVTSLNERIRKSIDYKIWREEVFKRDNWTCIKCGGRNGRGITYYLHADHIKQFAYFPELRFDVDNGRTLCKDCHYERHTKEKNLCL